MEYQRSSRKHVNYTALSLLFVNVVPQVPLIGLVVFPVYPFCS